MKSTAILNLKGGVGKTTTVINMALMLSAERRVLVVDCDPQCNLSQFFEANPKKGTIPNVLVNANELYGVASIQSTHFRNVDILAADDSLMELDLSQLTNERVKPYSLRMLVCELARRDSYDYILFDCPPAFNGACASALFACDDVVIPIKLDAFSVTGMANVMQQVRNMQRINSRLKVSGILPTMWYRDEVIQEAEEVLKNSTLHIFPHIRRSNKADEMTFSRVMPHGNAGHIQDYKAFLDEYMGVTK